VSIQFGLKTEYDRRELARDRNGGRWRRKLTGTSV
jgi:hypothetical protein